MKVTASTLLLSTFLVSPLSPAFAEFKAGAAIVDVTPTVFPVLVNGNMLSNSTDKVKTAVNARAIVLADGKEQLAIVVVDSCMMSRDLLDEAKQLASERTGIRHDHILVAATHTHTGPASMGCLGTDADPRYVPVLRQKIAEAIVAAQANLEPARVGWGVADAGQYTALRRWIRRPDRLAEDPFGNPTVRANMHAGRNWDDVTGESGPEDPDLSLISIQAKDGRPIAVMANFSMHYFGDQPLSADYFGLFCEGLQEKLDKSKESGKPAFVGLMSHGCSGDIWRRDYTVAPKKDDKDLTINEYAQAMVGVALKAYGQIKYAEEAELAMAEARLRLNYRVPDKQRLEWAQKIVAAMGDRLPQNTTEVYAREQILLHEKQSTDVVVQGIRIGDIGIATTPTETYALTGLKIKKQSPLAHTMVLDLTNGGDGYIPPPEQHLLGGYNTWAARSAGLEILAEPKITETAIQLLEQAAGTARKAFVQSRGTLAQAILDAKPFAYWRLDEFAGPHVADSSGHHQDASYEPGVVYFLEGAASADFCQKGEVNRAAHFAGGRIRTRIAEIGNQYSVSLWIWNGLPLDARATAGWMFSRGREHRLDPHGYNLGLGGTEHPGKLVFQQGVGSQPVAGKTAIERWTWNQVVLVRDGAEVRVYLNGSAEPEITTKVSTDLPEPFDQFFFGGRCDNDSNWEGRLDEIAVFDRPLSVEEIAKLHGK